MIGWSGPGLGGWSGRQHRAFDWPVRLAMLNLLWLAGTLAGLVVVGIAPATMAMVWLIREYSVGRDPRPWRAFWRCWRAELAPSQLRLGVPMATVVVLGFYLAASAGRAGSVFRAVTVTLAILLVVYVATLLYLPAVLAHFDLPTITAWQVAVVAAWRQPLLSLVVAIGGVAMVMGMAYLLPAALPFYAVSLPAFIATRAALRAFSRLTELPR